MVPTLGPACRVGDLWEVVLADGTRISAHGSDPAGPVADTLGLAVPPVAATCASSGYYARVLYARPSGAPDAYAEHLPTIREAVAQANGLLRLEGAELGRSLSLKVRCNANGDVDVTHVALPLTVANHTFAEVTQALRNAGYTSTAQKYWVFYDGTTDRPGVAGTGSVYNDTRLTLDNRNNAGTNTVAMFSVVWGPSNFNAHVILHEATHNMGGVQNIAPNSSGAYHCIDGDDVMCYADGGPRSGSFSDAICADAFERYDCGHDDYFHPFPAPGSYLATHWNVGSTLNRFLDHSTGCDFTRTGSILAGTLGVGVEGVSMVIFDGIPQACTGLPFSLSGEDDTLADLDVCWTDAAGEQITCDANAGHESGLVPPGTRGARIAAFTGVDTAYWFAVG